MLSLLGSALGFAGSALPAVTEIWKNKSNQKFELERMKVQAELSKAGLTMKSERMRFRPLIRSMRGSYSTISLSLGGQGS